MNEDKLKKIFDNHKLWLETHEKKGKKAQLIGFNLFHTDLTDVNLERADLRYTNLWLAEGTNLTGANLASANLRCAYLTRTDLKFSNLYMADFHGAELIGTNLTGANLYGAKNIYQFGPIGEEARIGYAVKHFGCIMIQLGCFWNTSDRAIEEVRKKYGKKSLYEKQIKLAVKILEAQ